MSNYLEFTLEHGVYYPFCDDAIQECLKRNQPNLTHSQIVYLKESGKTIGVFARRKEVRA